MARRVSERGPVPKTIYDAGSKPITQLKPGESFKRAKERTWDIVPDDLEEGHCEAYINSHRNLRFDSLFEFISCF
jgi:hypothetical protein